MKKLVVFRKMKEGEVIALFPEVPASPCGFYCQSYQAVGQHGAADYGFMIASTKPAVPEEYGELEEELKRVGYDLLVRKKYIRRKR